MLNVVDEQTETDGVDYSVSEDDAPSNCQLTSQSHTQLQLLNLGTSSSRSSLITQRILTANLFSGESKKGSESVVIDNHFQSSQLKLSFEVNEVTRNGDDSSNSLL